MNRPRHIQGLMEAVRCRVALFGQVRSVIWQAYFQELVFGFGSGQQSVQSGADRCSVVWYLLVSPLGESFEHPNGKALGDLCILVAICLDP